MIYQMKRLSLLILLGGLIATNGFAQQQGNVCWDSSGHNVSLIDIGEDVQIEALDWGGDGGPLIFLPGLGNTGHIFDDFVFNFTPEYRVISISPRGFGRSSGTETGYSSETRAADIIAVMDQLSIDKATIIGHSIAGDQLSFLGANYSDRVASLIYLDAYDYGDGTLMKIFPEIPPEVNAVRTASRRDSLSVYHYKAHLSRSVGEEMPLSEVCAGWKLDSEGGLTESTTYPAAFEQVMMGTHEAEFEKIDMPVLGIFATSKQMLTQDQFRTLSATNQEILRKVERKFQSWGAEQLVRFETRLPKARLEVIDGAHHYIFLSDSGLTSKLMLDFLAQNGL